MIVSSVATNLGEKSGMPKQLDDREIVLGTQDMDVSRNSGCNASEIWLYQCSECTIEILKSPALKVELTGDV